MSHFQASHAYSPWVQASAATFGRYHPTPCRGSCPWHNICHSKCLSIYKYKSSIYKYNRLMSLSVFTPFLSIHGELCRRLRKMHWSIALAVCVAHAFMRVKWLVSDHKKAVRRRSPETSQGGGARNQGIMRKKHVTRPLFSTYPGLNRIIFLC